MPVLLPHRGRRRELRRRRDVEVDMRPFELRPDPLPTLRTEDGYLPGVWNASVYPMARRMGGRFTADGLPAAAQRQGVPDPAVGAERGVGDAYSDAMFRAFFQQDRNIGEDAVVIDVAESVGLDRGDVIAAFTDEDRRRRADQEYAVATVGVSAVPAFRVDGRLAHGDGFPRVEEPGRNLASGYGRTLRTLLPLRRRAGSRRRLLRGRPRSGR
ncbi:DsbA family oxidoreductase [Streptomonospora wellingtoniae]|uniref:DsbA family oxidoreductase n=1 Tax=Streptomonospora wellingtoniae TaxID=3075544 RepID=UPI0037D9BD66